jgi:hypothetical protein
LIISLSSFEVCEEPCDKRIVIHCHGLVSEFDPFCGFPGSGCEQAHENKNHLLPLIGFDLFVVFNFRLGKPFRILLSDSPEPEIKENDARLLLVGFTRHSFTNEVNSDKTRKDDLQDKVNLDEVNHEETVLTVGH